MFPCLSYARGAKSIDGWRFLCKSRIFSKSTLCASYERESDAGLRPVRARARSRMLGGRGGALPVRLGCGSTAAAASQAVAPLTSARRGVERSSRDLRCRSQLHLRCRAVVRDRMSSSSCSKIVPCRVCAGGQSARVAACGTVRTLAAPVAPFTSARRAVEHSSRSSSHRYSLAVARE